MQTQEWPLIIFTILAQMSVGSFLVLGAVHFLAGRVKGAQWADRLSSYALLAIGPVLILAMAASVFHLGNILNAPRALLNLGSSWLSREILFGVSFAVLGGIFAIMQWRKIASFAVRNVVAVAAALVGVALVFSMAMLYMLPNQPAWNSWTTPVSFYATTVLLGLFAIGGAFVVTMRMLRRKDPSCEADVCGLVRASLKWIAIAAIVVLGVQVLVSSFHLVALAAGDPAMQETARMTVGQFGALLGLRIALGFVGAGVLALFIYQLASTPGRERLLGNLVLAAFALVLVSEVLGRYLFYSTHVGLGL